jgi:hypothetical protein
MARRLIGLAIVLLIANAGWKVAPVFLHHFEFKVELEELARFGGELSDSEIQAKAVRTAASFQLPVTDRDVQVRRSGDHVYIDVAYREMLEVLPRYKYPWDFTIHVNVLSAKMRPGA